MRSSSSRPKQQSKFAAGARAGRDQPTFTRYIFELPELISVTAERGKDKLTLMFDKPLRFDLADAKLCCRRGGRPRSTPSGDADTATVQLHVLASKVDVRTFREDNNYVVDVSPIDAKAASR